MELIAAGFLGSISEIHVWHPEHSWPSGVPRPEGNDPIPPGLDWDFWLGPAATRPHKFGVYHPAQWRGWYDFGNGSLGDFCCHGFNLPMRALDLDYPTRIEINGTEIGLAGILALRLRRNIDWDGPGMQVPGIPEADRLIHSEPRRDYL